MTRLFQKASAIVEQLPSIAASSSITATRLLPQQTPGQVEAFEGTPGAVPAYHRLLLFYPAATALAGFGRTEWAAVFDPGQGKLVSCKCDYG